MKLLLVENSPRDAGILLAACGQLNQIEVDIAESLETANELIDRRHGEYDVAIFDLQIPTTDDALDEHVDHGLAAFVRLGSIAPGTIRFVWSGKATSEAYEQILTEQNQADPLGVNSPEPMVKFFAKDKFRDCIACLTGIAESMAALNGIEWSWGVEQSSVDQMTRRVVDIFARRRDGVIVKAAPLGDGLSGAAVFRLQVTAEDGSTAASVVGKVGSVGDVTDELSRYSRHVAPVLDLGAYAPLTDEVLEGADGLGGAFYRLVDPEAKPLFDLAMDDSEAAAEAVERLAGKLAPWQEGVPPKRVSVADVRRTMITDAYASAFASQIEAERDTVEPIEVFVHESTIHGDLHGQNVLVDSQNDPILIDYGEVRKGAAALDPVTLELSALLHPKSPMKGLWNWDPSLWMRSDEFFSNCPAQPFFRALRKWAHNVAAGDREVCAAAYAYCLRQLKYDDVDRQLAEQLAVAIAASLPNP